MTTFEEHIEQFKIHTQYAAASINTAANLILTYGDLVPRLEVNDQPWDLTEYMRWFGYTRRGNSDWTRNTLTKEEREIVIAKHKELNK